MIDATAADDNDDDDNDDDDDDNDDDDDDKHSSGGTWRDDSRKSSTPRRRVAAQRPPLLVHASGVNSAAPVQPINGMIRVYDTSKERKFMRPHSAKTVFFYRDNDTFYTVSRRANGAAASSTRRVAGSTSADLQGALSNV